MMSVEMREIHAFAENYDKTLKATDPRFHNVVIVHSLNDMSFFTYSESFAMQYKNWYCIFTEHYGFHLYHMEDAKVAMYSNRLEIEELK